MNRGKTNMSTQKSLTKNLSKQIIAVGISLLLLGFSLWGISIFMIQQREQLLANGGLNPEDVWAYESSLEWWQDTYDTLFFPLAIVLIVLGAIILVSQQLLLKSSIFTTDDRQKQSVTESLDQSIFSVLAVKHPENIEQLIHFVQKETEFSEAAILNRVLSLHDENKLNFVSQPAKHKSRFNYVFSPRAIWYWILMLFTCVTVFVVFQVPEYSYPESYVRPFLGAFFVLLAPGYALAKALYPGKRLELTERLGLSIALSIALVCLNAFLLNFSPWKITLLPLVVSLSLLIILFSTIGVFREGNNQ